MADTDDLFRALRSGYFIVTAYCINIVISVGRYTIFFRFTISLISYICIKFILYMLDIKWNYTVNIEHELNFLDPLIRQIIGDLQRTEYGIIHYTGGSKPWNKVVPLGEHYHKYAEKLKNELS